MTALPSTFQVKRQALKENDLPEILLITRTEYVQPAFLQVSRDGKLA